MVGLFSATLEKRPNIFSFFIVVIYCFFTFFKVNVSLITFFIFRKLRMNSTGIMPFRDESAF